MRLEAPPAELEARVRSRDSGRELEEHLAEIEAARRPEFAHIAVANHGRPVVEVADEILAVTGW